MYLTSSSISKEELEEKKVENKYIFISSKIKKNHVIIKIKANAQKKKNNKITHIYEPYFTTKDKRKGTGLGLNITYNCSSRFIRTLSQKHSDSFKVEIF